MTKAMGETWQEFLPEVGAPILDRVHRLAKLRRDLEIAEERLDRDIRRQWSADEIWAAKCAAFPNLADAEQAEG